MQHLSKNSLSLLCIYSIPSVCVCVCVIPSFSHTRGGFIVSRNKLIARACSTIISHDNSHIGQRISSRRSSIRWIAWSPVIVSGALRSLRVAHHVRPPLQGRPSDQCGISRHGAALAGLYVSLLS